MLKIINILWKLWYILFKISKKFKRTAIYLKYILEFHIYLLSMICLNKRQ